MAVSGDRGLVIVTGAGGHIGREVCRLLKATDRDVLAVDVDSGAAKDLVVCDLRAKDQVSSLFRGRPVRTVIHLAAILPSAFLRDPFAGVDVNLVGCFELLRQAVTAGVKRFVFASSMSVYGALRSESPATEEKPPEPDDPHGASQRVVEVVGETLARATDRVRFLADRSRGWARDQEEFVSVAFGDFRAVRWARSDPDFVPAGCPAVTGARRGCRAHAGEAGRSAAGAPPDIQHAGRDLGGRTVEGFGRKGDGGACGAGRRGRSWRPDLRWGAVR